MRSKFRQFCDVCAPKVVRPQTPHAQLLRAVEVLREAALSLFNKQSGSPRTTWEACDLLSQACELLWRVPCELVPAHLQHRQQTREDTVHGVQVPESVNCLRQLGSDLCRERQVAKLFHQTQYDTSLRDSVLASVDYRSQHHSVLSRNNGVTRTAKAAVKFLEQSLKKLKKPIARLQIRKPAHSADDVSCSTPV